MTVNGTGKTVTVQGEFNVQVVPWSPGGVLQAITFSDGVSWTQAQAEQALLAQEATASGGSIIGFSGNDTLVAGLGDKLLQGGGAADTYVYSAAGGNDVIDDGGWASSTLKTQDIASTDVTLSRSGGNLIMADAVTGKTVTVKGQFNTQVVPWSPGGVLQSITFADGVTWSAADVSKLILGSSGNDALTGTGSNDIFYASPGTDTLTGAGGYDTYKIGTDVGQTTINNLASDGVTTANGEIDFQGGIAANQLWFQQSGNDLLIKIMGTNSDPIDVSNWFGSDPRAQVQRFTTTDGSQLDSQVAQLVSAMATYSANNPGFDPGVLKQVPNDPTLQNALAAAWHH